MLLVFWILLDGSLQVSALQARQGDPFVLLPCKFHTFEVTNVTVEWSRSDLSPSNVHRRLEKGDELTDQNQLYRRRTSMRTDALEKGDLTLNVSRLQMSDNGTYTCTVSDYREILMQINVELHVEGGLPTWATVLLVLLFILVLCVSAGVLVYYRQYFMSEYRVGLDYGAESVLLPCRTTAHLPEHVKVEWTDGDNRKVHVYENGSDQPEEQNRFYRNRTKMEKKPKSGDLSLTLDHPTDEDQNIYTCSVYGREEKVLMQKRVHLEVRGVKEVKSSWPSG